MKTRAQAFLSGSGGDGGRQRTSGFGWRNKNSDVTNTFLSAINVNYYYHPNSSPKDWTDYDGFQTGQLVATCAMHAEMFSTVNGASWGGVSGPFTYSADFVLPDGSHANLQRLTRGGITVTTWRPLLHTSLRPLAARRRSST
jgi:hypothetical protein